MKGRSYLFFLLTLTCLFMTEDEVFAQDIHFTQYDLSPLTLNPANTGFMRGKSRFSAIYRDQWRNNSAGFTVGDAPFTTLSASFDTKINLKVNNIGAGLVLIGDRSGPGNLQQNRAYLSLAYQRRTCTHSISIGVQPGYVINSFDQFTFPNQFDPATGRYNITLPDGETELQTTKSYFDLNAGVAYGFRGDYVDLYAGFAIFHILEPDASFVQGGEEALTAVPRRYSFNLQVATSLSRSFYLTPSVLFMLQEGSSQLTPGLLLGYKLGEDKMNSLYLGAYWRNNILAEGTDFLESTDAFAASFGATIGSITFGLAYDINVSGFSEVTQGQGAFEAAIVYKNLFEAQPCNYLVPCRIF